MARRIESSDTALDDGEVWSLCVKCLHLVAVGLDDPSWGTRAPVCNVCEPPGRCPQCHLLNDHKMDCSQR